jgi:hypothetical protein
MMQSHQDEYEEMVEIGGFRQHQHSASDDSHPRLLNDNMRSNRSSRVNPDDFASPQWPPSIAGTGSSPSLTLRSGATTPYDHMSSSKHLIFADSRSSTPMVLSPPLSHAPKSNPPHASPPDSTYTSSCHFTMGLYRMRMLLTHDSCREVAADVPRIFR